MNQNYVIYNSTHERLVAEGFSPEQPLDIRKIVCTSENGKRYMLATNGNNESVVYQIDGDILKNGLRCDKLVLVKCSGTYDKIEKWIEAFIELKGTDTDRAVKQLRETLENDIFMHPSNIIRARIVAKSFPSNKSNPTIEKAKKEFRKNYDCDLRCMRSGQKDHI